MKNKFFVCGDEVFIKLTRGYWTIIDLIDLDTIKNISSWHASSEKARSGHVYAKYSKKIAKRAYAEKPMQDVIMGFPSSVVDHKNRNSLDNRRNNLRITTNSLNQLNAKIKINNTSGTIGITWLKDKKRWAAEIRINKKKIRLGSYINKEDAIEARSKAEDAYIP